MKPVGYIVTYYLAFFKVSLPFDTENCGLAISSSPPKNDAPGGEPSFAPKTPLRLQGQALVITSTQLQNSDVKPVDANFSCQVEIVR
jgi:hypothetical protein